MASIQCPNCGKDNPDFLDNCQFCQTVLRAESKLQIGENPTKKNTGELENVLPEWLRDVRKQGRESAEEGELPASSTHPRIQKNEAPDLLAGLASQNDDDEEDIPDWLSSINPVAKPKPSVTSKPEPSNDFFAQFNIEPEPVRGSETPKEEILPAPPAAQASEPPANKDELSEWFSSASKEPNEPFALQPDASQDVADWMGSLGTSQPASQSAPEEKEDLGWLHDLEASAKGPGQPSQPKQDWNFSAPSTPSSSQEDLSWLNNLGGMTPPAQPASSQPSQGDDLSWLNALGGVPAEPAQPASPKPSQKEDLSWLDNLGGTSAPAQPAASQPSKQDDLSWLNDLGGVSEPAKSVSSQPAPKEDLSWLKDLGGTSTPAPTSSSQPSQKEDLSWLNDLGGTSEPVQPATSQPASSDDMSWLNNIGQTSEPAQPTSSQEDLSWLNAIGGTAEPAQPASTPASSEDMSWLDSLGGVGEPIQPQTPAASESSSQEDLGWLDQFGGTSQPVQETPSAQEDLSWLNAFGGTTEPQAAVPSTSESDLDWLGKLGETPAPEEPAATPSTSGDELDWLKNFAASTSEPSQPASVESNDLGWLDTLSGTSEPAQSTPTEPSTSDSGLDWLSGLGDEASSMPGQIFAKPFGTTDELNPPKGEEDVSHITPFMPRRTAPLDGSHLNDDMPDWLKSATEETPNLPLGASALEQFRETPRKPLEGTFSSAPEPDTIGSNVIPSSNASLSSKDVDSLFSVDMPDWLSKSPEVSDKPAQRAEAPAVDDSLAPVELPSWVQAMRPVEAVLAESGVNVESQPTEKEGPLAGLRGVIPSAPIGSSRRPKAISLKLQASEEQQAGASLFDRILAGETAPRVLESVSTVNSQNVLRWTISGILIVVLSAILFMRSQIMPVSKELPLDVSAATGAINAIPNNSSVLVVVDYEPSLAGEMEAVSIPVLNQIVFAHQPKLVLLATSPESTGLIERLLTSAHINTADGFAYTSGNQYFNLGYLPGGTAGIMGFITRPQQVTPSITALQSFQGFTDFKSVVLLTDHAESGRAWVEQLDVARQTDPSLANQSVILVTSAQTGPLLQPYVSSKQAAGMINGLADAARFEEFLNIPPKIAHTYWDAFGIGILLAILSIIIGSVWSLVSGFRARRLSGEQG